MKATFAWLTVLFVFSQLAGCAGTDFVRPDTEALRNGRTTYVEAIQRLGKPVREGTVQKNGKTFRTASYVYVSRGGKPLREGVTPSRVLVLSFDNDTLVGYEFASSWADDHTNFDEAKAGDLVKGKTTREQALRIMGRPSGFHIPPLIKAPAKEAAVYIYVEVKGSLFGMQTFQKELIVSFDDADLVSDVDFMSRGTQ